MIYKPNKAGSNDLDILVPFFLAVFLPRRLLQITVSEALQKHNGELTIFSGNYVDHVRTRYKYLPTKQFAA